MGHDDTHPQTTHPHTSRHGRVFQVWNIQERVEHYRVPVWDRLVACGRGTYDFKIYGPTQDGKPFGGKDSRSYIHHLPLEKKSFLGQSTTRWPGSETLVSQERPDVVIITANPRNTDAWKLPKVCRRIGCVPIAWSKVHSRYSGLPKSVLRFAKQRLFPRYELHVVYGDQSKAELTGLGVEPSRIYVARNTIDTARIFEMDDIYRSQGEQLRREHGLIGKKILLMIAAMKPGKRHRDVLEAWPSLRRLSPDLVLVLVGGGELYDQVKHQAKETDPDRIIVTGSVPEGMDYAWIATADFNIQPGAVGLAINQSMAFGIPTIIADEPGADSEILVHDQTGWRYPKGDLKAMTKLVGRLLRDPDRVERCSSDTRKLMREKITIQGMVDSIDATVRRALELHRTWKGNG